MNAKDIEAAASNFSDYATQDLAQNCDKMSGVMGL